MTNNKSNSGIVNYLFSFVRALNILNDEQKPSLVIFHSADASLEMIKNEQYPYIRFWQIQPQIPVDIVSRIVNKAARLILGKNIVFNKRISAKDADYIFPFPHNSNFDAIKGRVHWLVDFNPYYFPNHLSNEQRRTYFEQVEYIVHSTDKVILSSYDILKDLKKFFPAYTCKVEILRFASLLPDFSHVNIDDVKAKFDITHLYIMTPNQFWVHKNHMVMLEAAVILKKKGIHFQMVFTGSTNVELESNYYLSLIDFITKHGLESEVRILGLVDRSEQLALMKGSVALVQPSLFEGWSTLVEESKALNKHIVVSDLPIHREQIDFNCTFFEAGNSDQLASILEDLFVKGPKVVPYDYQIDIARYAERIVEIFN